MPHYRVMPMSSYELPTNRVYGQGYIDELELHLDPSLAGRQLVVKRTYDRIAEKLDSDLKKPLWERWTAALQGPE